MNIRVRFAPSPTGYLHVGGARTAIYNYLFARKHRGTFLLRVEDTDVERSTEAAIRTILEGLTWMGIRWDEGPFFQSHFVAKHRETAERLLNEGLAYRCFATPEELKEQREAFLKEGKTWRYDARYREMDRGKAERLTQDGTPYVVRFRVPREGGVVAFNDMVYGPQERAEEEIEDFALARPDGSPLYNLSVVVDDAFMNISHVIRGQDHLANTFKQILLYRAMEKPLPEFAHLPLILAPDKSKLSKRKHGEAVSVTAYRDRGFLPQAFVNFLSLVGWNPGDDREILSLEELTELFDFSRVNRANAVFHFDVQKGEWTDRKAVWMNGEYLSSLPLEELLPLVEDRLKNAGLWDDSYAAERKDWFARCVEMIRRRFHDLEDFVTLGRAYFSDEFEMDEKAVNKRVVKPANELKKIFPEFIAELENLEAFREDLLEDAVRGFCEEREIKAGLVNNAARIFVTGRPAGPGIYEIFTLLGRERVLRRLRKGMDFLQSV